MEKVGCRVSWKEDRVGKREVGEEKREKETTPVNATEPPYTYGTTHGQQARSDKRKQMATPLKGHRVPQFYSRAPPPSPLLKSGSLTTTISLQESRNLSPTIAYTSIQEQLDKREKLRAERERNYAPHAKQREELVGKFPCPPNSKDCAHTEGSSSSFGALALKGGGLSRHRWSFHITKRRHRPPSNNLAETPIPLGQSLTGQQHPTTNPVTP